MWWLSCCNSPFMLYPSNKTTLNASNQMWKQNVGKIPWYQENPPNFEAVVPSAIQLISAGLWSVLCHLCGRWDYAMTLWRLLHVTEITQVNTRLSAWDPQGQQQKWQQTAEGDSGNFHTKQSSSPGPIIKAPPCWAGSPWKSKAGPVIALHILLILPRRMFDFTWGLRTKQNHNTLVI